ncbi:MAG: hypothetical protein WDN04_28065 [Rhodospirillales bacterium]
MDLRGQGPIHIHVAEQRAEVATCVETLGAPPVAWLLDHAAVNGAWCLVACDACECQGDCRCGAYRRGDRVVPQHGGGSRRRAVRFPRVPGGVRRVRHRQRQQRDAGCIRGIAAAGLWAAVAGERRNVAAGDNGHSGRALWQQAARGGAAACGRAAGRIATGLAADFVVIEPTAEAFGQKPDFALDAAMFGAVRAPARHVMVGGAWQVRDGVHRNEAKIDSGYRAALKALGA